MSDPAVVSAERWYRIYRPVATARLRLICLPHAGGGASFFRDWPDLLPADVELLAVRYPGREDRFAEPCVDDMDTLADLITAAVAPLFTAPVAMFGHSMGASVAYEVARRLHTRHGVDPTVLLLSSREAPHVVWSRGLHTGTDAQLLDGVRALGEVDPEAWEHPELRELMLPVLRADYRLIERYRLAEPVVLPTPIVAYVAVSDTGCAVDGAREWSQYTSISFQTRLFPGDHFYLVPQRAALLADVVTRLRTA